MAHPAVPHFVVTADVGDRSWVDQGLCAGRTEVFFAPPGERERRRLNREALARSYCAICPVQADCRDAGRRNRENGIWGGENDLERALAGYAPRSIFRRDVAEARLIGLERESDTPIALDPRLDADTGVESDA